MANLRNEPSRLRRRMRRLVGASLCAVLTATALTPAHAAQVDIIDYEIDDGDFTGFVALTGNFSVDIAQYDSRASGEMVVWIDVDGPASMQVRDGVVGGAWSFDGDGGLTGAFSSQGFDVNVHGDTVYDATGSFTGDSSQARLVGTLNSTGTAEVVLPGPAIGFNPGPQTSSASDPIEATLTDVLAGCRQVVARFERELTADIEAALPGAAVNARGIVSLFDDVTDDEQEEALAGIVEAASALEAGSNDALVDLSAAAELLRDIQRLQDELNENSDCPQSKEFFTTLTLTATSVANRALDAVEALANEDGDRDATLAAVLPAIVELILATGSDGAGAAETSGTLARAETMGRDAWNQLMAADDLDTSAILRLSAMAVQMGWDFNNGNVDAGDMFAVLGGDR